MPQRRDGPWTRETLEPQRRGGAQNYDAGDKVLKLRRLLTLPAPPGVDRVAVVVAVVALFLLLLLLLRFVFFLCSRLAM